MLWLLHNYLGHLSPVRADTRTHTRTHTHTELRRYTGVKYGVRLKIAMDEMGKWCICFLL